MNIENKVLNIENAVLIRDIDFADNEPMDISRFMEYFDTYRNKLLAELVKDYQNIGDIYLKSIEETTCKQKEVHKKNEDMAPYYQYWEKRIFNAITKMIIRAMASNKALWQ